MATPDFNELLKTKWLTLFQSPEAPDIFRNGFDTIKMKLLEGGYLVYFNESMIKNKRISQIEFPNNQEETKEFQEYFPKLHLLQEFDSKKFNFNKCTSAEILFYVNLDEETVITKEVNDKWEEDHLFDEQQLENEISETENHPIIVNVSPICPYHSILPLFPQEELPQTIGQDIIMLLLQLFKISNSNELRVGFNSLGAFSTVNHLHFQLLYINDLFDTTKRFPIENCPRKELHRTSLQKPNEQINIYSVGVIIEELLQYPIRGFVLKPYEEKADLGDIYSSLSYVAGTITNLMLERSIAHNIMFADLGQTIYIIPRQHQENQKSKSFRCAWQEVCGVALSKDEEGFNSVTKQSYEEILGNEVSLSEKDFNELKEQVVDIFRINYE